MDSKEHCSHLHNIRVESKYRKVQRTSLCHVVGRGAVLRVIQICQPKQSKEVSNGGTQVGNPDSSRLLPLASLLNHSLPESAPAPPRD